MNPVANDEQFEHLRAILLPILTDAAIGRFNANIPYQDKSSREFNEVLMGVQGLIDVIRQQQQIIEQAEADLADVQERTTEILARVLDRSLPEYQYHNPRNRRLRER
ncbi:MAG TPA: hypothetical protein VLI05_05100 [Candidatus Saccharimonadia bacterium]|nr:hypothetical protein [Candidatus Saccharimonadia bacterium]